MDAKKSWQCTLNELYADVGTSEFGLSAEQAGEKLRLFGKNAIPDKDKKEWFDILIAQIKSPLLLMLIAASIVSAGLGEVFDTAIIIVVISVSVILGFFQEYKSERVLAELKKYFSYRAIALRGGEKVQIDATELVPGDVVFCGLGDIVPADIRIIESKGIVVNESILTGESREMTKTPEGKADGPSAQEIKNGIFMGTTVIDGFAKGVVVATGKETFFGKAASVFSAKVPESDFQIGIRKFGDMLLKVILALVLFVFIVNYLLNHGAADGKNPLVESALFALALAVGIAPEALPAVVTITLSSGSLRLAKKKVITKKLAAIEDLGNMDVLCTDKTGTLTEEGLVMEQFVDFDTRDSHPVFEYAFLCNAAVGAMHVKGNPIDVAIRKRGLAKKLDVSQFTKIADIPFDYNRRRMSVVVREGKKFTLVTKGAPESVLEACTKVKVSGKLLDMKKEQKRLRQMMDEHVKEGMSAIAVAYKEMRTDKKEYTKEDEKDLVFIGFVLFSNPPKQTVKATLERLKLLNIRLKIITGDDPLIAKKLCSDVGFLPADGTIIIGHELAAMKTEEFAKAVERCDVFARVTPEQKLAIVEALRANGHVVGFMGDGINDAPALRAADVGISVNTAADVAKGASHIILLQKSLGVVCDGAAEGRTIFGNITKYLLYVMSSNAGNMVTVAISSLFLPFIPLLHSQILLNNLLSDIPLMSISSDNVDKVYTRRPQKWNNDFILKFMLFFGLISSVFDLLLICILYFVMPVDTTIFRTAWFLESILSEMIIVYSLRTHLPFFKSMPSKLLLGMSAAAAAVAIGIVYFEPVAKLFYLVPLPPVVLEIIAAILVGYFALTELGKALFFGYLVPGKEN